MKKKIKTIPKKRDPYFEPMMKRNGSGVHIEKINKKKILKKILREELSEN